jgi:hypothetical protein
VNILTFEVSTIWQAVFLRWIKTQAGLIHRQFMPELFCMSASLQSGDRASPATD